MHAAAPRVNACSHFWRRRARHHDEEAAVLLVFFKVSAASYQGTTNVDSYFGPHNVLYHRLRDPFPPQMMRLKKISENQTTDE